MKMPDSRNASYTTRLQKGGALFEDMRRIIMVWSDEISKENIIPFLARSLAKSSISRVRDIYTDAFRPRFIGGSPPDAWRLAKILENEKADVEVLRAFYYWITARTEAPLYEFVSEFVFSKSRSPDRQIRISETISWLSHRLNQQGKSWTPVVTKKVAQGMLAALRDFGILEGNARKQVEAKGLSAKAFAIIAFCLHGMGASSQELVSHPDWRIFLLSEVSVERLFLECHQFGWLKFYSAGDLKRVEFPNKTFLEFSHAVLS